MGQNPSLIVPTEKSFVHSPFDDPSQEIRLVRLVVDDEEGRPSLELAHIGFDAKIEVPEYDALSYTWGSAKPSRSILINGCAFEIRQNLFDFLVEARRRKHDSWIWIDQLSIDQTNIDERNRQVRNMDRIYMRASRVLIWLGATDNQHGHVLQEYILQNFSQGEPFRNPFLFNGPIANSGEQKGLAIPTCVRQSVIALCEVPYFARLWIVQEVTLARTRILWWNSYHFEDSHIRRLVLDLLDSRLELHVEMSFIGWLLRPPYLHRTDLTLTQVLMQIPKLHCADSLDMLYGLQSIIRAGSQIEIDYYRRIEEVFQDGLVVVAVECWLEPNHHGQLSMALNAAAGLGHAMMPQGFDTSVLADHSLSQFLEVRMREANARRDDWKHESVEANRSLVRSWIVEFREGETTPLPPTNRREDPSPKYWIKEELRPHGWRPSIGLVLTLSTDAARLADV